MTFTFNGIGTKYYGSSDKKRGGSYVATKWFVVAFLPITPLSSCRMPPVAGEKNFMGLSTTQLEMEPVPMHWKQVRNTYLIMIGVIVVAVGLAVILT